MKNILYEMFEPDKVISMFSELYGNSDEEIDRQLDRYNKLYNDFCNAFQVKDSVIHFFSTPGRTEIGGNHTDHNRGRVLAASVNLDTIAVVSKNNTGIITVYSQGYDKPFVVDISELTPRESEYETTNALIRGIASRFKEKGLAIGGFDAFISSAVLRGSGLSSSASIEVLLGTIFNSLYNNNILDSKQLAVIGQYAENVFFNKPCGLMDQMACAVGGFVSIDFKDADNPVVRKIDYDFEAEDYSLLVIDTGGNHADLTADYASIPNEMKSIADALGKNVLSELSISDVISNIPSLRSKAGDRAILRALHFFGDNERVVKQAKALEEKRFQDFLKLIIESGSSSWRLLQNCYTISNPSEQGISLALAVTENFLNEKGKGAYRVHGGGFAGTIQVFMPKECLSEYLGLISNLFGEEAVTVLSIRPCGTLYLNKALKS